MVPNPIVRCTMSTITTQVSQTFWRAAIAADSGKYIPQSPQAFIDGLGITDPDCRNAIKIILNASSVVAGNPLPLDGKIEDRDREAIYALAKAAELNEEGLLPED